MFTVTIVNLHSPRVLSNLGFSKFFEKNKMKPYGRERNVKSWKKDHHVIINHRKVKNWWEVIVKFLSRSRIKQEAFKREREIE
jgi:hypothetical protein